MEINTLGDLWRVKRLVWLVLFGVTFCSLLTISPGRSALAPMPAPTAITPWYNSCFVDFVVPAGATDVRWVPTNSDGSLQKICKYAGLNYTAAVATIVGEIQVQGIAPGKTQTGVLQAVSEVGPTPPANLIDQHDLPTVPAAAILGTPEIGRDMGLTGDGFMSTNGGGLYTNVPVVLAQSAPITLTSLKAKPKAIKATKCSGAAKQFWRTRFLSATSFSAPVVTAPAFVNANLGMDTITALQADHVGYTVFEQGLDTYPGHTQVFQNMDHLMWVAVDGGQFDTNNPYHMAHGYIGIQPNKTFTLTANTCLRIEWSVDSVNIDGRKAVEFLVEPESDPITNFSGLDQGPAEIMNQSNLMLAVRAGITNYQATEGLGIKTPAVGTTPPVPAYFAVDGSLGQAVYCPWRDKGANGKGRDDQSDIVLYLSSAGLVVTEDGAVEVSNDWAGHVPAWLTAAEGIRFEAASICYHTDLCQANEEQYHIDDAPEWNDLSGAVYSDERHMNLLTAQVLPVAEMPTITTKGG